MVKTKTSIQAHPALLAAILLATTTVAQADKSDQWHIEHSQPDTDGAFLNVPINYGQWVPLSNAKATILNVASHLQSLGNQHHQGHASSNNDRVSNGQVTYVSSEEARQEVLEPATQHFRPAQRPVAPQQQRFQGARPQRRQDWITKHRQQNGFRQVRKLPRPHHVAPPPSSSFVDTITSFFSSSSASQQPQQAKVHPHRNLPQQHHQHTNQPIHQQQPQLPQQPQPIADSFPSESLNVGTVFNLPPPYRTKPSQPQRPKVNQAAVAPPKPINAPFSQAKETLLTPNPVIKVVNAPDLSQDGPPVIEIGGNQRQEELGFRPQHDHLSGFVPVNFEHSTSGHKFPHFSSNTPKKTTDESRSDYSVVVTGFEGKPDATRLAQFLKEGKVEKTEAFIANSGGKLPQGFQEVDLPFMNKHTKGSELPSVFIAPVGFEVPEGYKGHRLPFDPKIVDARKPIRRPTQLVEDVNSSQTTSSYKDASALIRDKLKLAKKRPSLSSFYRNKARKDSENVEKDIVKDAIRKTTKKRRVLKKIVRRPFKNSVRNTFRATPATKVINPDNPFLTERPRIIVDLSVSTEPTTTTDPSTSSPVPEKASPTTATESAVSSTTSTTTSTTTTSTTSTAAPIELQETTFRSLFQDVSNKEAEIEDTTVTIEEVEPTSGYEPTVRVAIPADHFEPTTQDEQPSLLLVTTTTEEPKPSTSTWTTQSTSVADQTEVSYESTSAPYAPTPFLRPRPVRRLDSYNRLRNQKKVLGPTLPPPVITTTTPRSVEQTKYRYGSNNKLNSGSEASSTRVFGQRIRSRKRPSTWNRYQEDLDNRATSTTEKSQKTEEYKRKFRPFFDQLYNKLSNGKAASSTRPRKRFYARRRSTTTPNPYTIDAEIYEIHPESGHRVTGTTTTETIEEIEDSYPTEETSSIHHSLDYEYLEPSATPVSETAHTSSEKQESYEKLEPTKPDPPALEYEEVELNVETTTEVEHETADKHSTTPPPPQWEEQPTFAPFDINTPYTYPEAPLNYDYVANDIIDRADVDAGDLEYLDSQRIETTWNDVDYYDNDKATSVDESEQRLSHYQKEFAPSHQIVEEHDAGYQAPVDLVNEHSQQHFQQTEDGFVPVHINKDSSGLYTYVEIQRGEDGSSIVVETTPAPISLDASLVVDASVPFETISNVETTTNDYEEETEETTTATNEGFDLFSEIEEEIIETIGAIEKQEEEGTIRDTTLSPTVEISDAQDTLVEELESDIHVPENVEDLVQFGSAQQEEETTASNAEVNVKETTTEVDADVTTTPQSVEVSDKEATNLDTTTASAIEEAVTTVGFFDNIGGIFNYFLPSSTPTTTETTTEEQSTTEAIAVETTSEDIEVKTTTEADQITTETTTEEDVGDTTTEATTDARSAQPKSIDTNEIIVPVSNSVREKPQKSSAPKKFLEDKLGYVVKKREQLIKNWVQRKYAKNNPTKYEPLKTTFAPAVSTESGETPVTTTITPTETAATNEEVAKESNPFPFPFAPTIIPKGKYVKDENKLQLKKQKYKKQSLLDKYTNARKTHLLAKKPTESSSSSSSSLPAVATPKRPRIPLGSSPNVYKKWAGGSLSQSEFERQILGVSTATQVSVQSRICVRGRCYNADDMTEILN